MFLLLALLYPRISSTPCSVVEIIDVQTAESKIHDELFEQSMNFDQALYSYLFTIAPSADRKFTMHQLESLKIAMERISTSIEYGVIDIPGIQQMCLTQNMTKVISTITEMMGYQHKAKHSFDVSELLINEKLPVIPSHMITHHLSMQSPEFSHFIELWEEDQINSEVIKKVLLSAFEDGGYEQLMQIQSVLAVSARITCPDAMIEDYLFDLASKQNDTSAMKVLDNFIQSSCPSCGSIDVVVRCTDCEFSFYCNRECQIRDWNRSDDIQPNHQELCPAYKEIEQIFQKIKGAVNSVVAHVIREFVLWEYKNDEWQIEVVHFIYQLIMESEVDELTETVGTLMGADHILYNAVSIRNVINELAEVVGIECIFEEPSIGSLRSQSDSFAALLNKLQRTQCKEDLELIDDVFFVAKLKMIWWRRWKVMLLQNNTDGQYMHIINRLAVRVGIDLSPVNETWISPLHDVYTEQYNDTSL